NDIYSMIVKNASYLKKYATNGSEVYRITTENGKQSTGFCDDYAQLIEAFSMVFKVTGDETWLILSKSITNTMIQKFYDDQNHCFSYTTKEQADFIVRKNDLFDNVT